MAKKPEVQTVPGSIPKKIAKEASEVQARIEMLRKSVLLLQEFINEYKPDTAAKAATMLVAVEPLWKMVGEVSAVLGTTVNSYRVAVIPERFVAESLKTFTLATSSGNYRFTVNQQFRATVVEGHKDEAIEWLEANGYEDIVQETINSSTLSAFAKKLVEDEGKDLPDTIFKVAQVPVTSVTKT